MPKVKKKPSIMERLGSPPRNNKTCIIKEHVNTPIFKNKIWFKEEEHGDASVYKNKVWIQSIHGKRKGLLGDYPKDNLGNRRKISSGLLGDFPKNNLGNHLKISPGLLGDYPKNNLGNHPTNNLYHPTNHLGNHPMNNLYHPTSNLCNLPTNNLSYQPTNNLGNHPESSPFKKRILPQRKVASRPTECPSEYKKAAKALRAVVECGITLNDVFNGKINGNKLSYALAALAVDYRREVNHLLMEFKIIEENKKLDPWLLRVLMTEMIWGTQVLKSHATVVEAMRYYEESVRENCWKMTTVFPDCFKSVAPMLPTYVRVNTLQVTVDNAIQNFCKEGWTLAPRCNTYTEHLRMVKSLKRMSRHFMVDFHVPELLVFPPNCSFYNHRGYLTGKLILQDKGSCLASYLLNPRPGSTVLDLCAAPGLKTNHIANLMENKGLLYANDIHPERFADLSKFLKLTNVQCAHLTNDDLFDLQVAQAPKVDYILVDASCTYSGMFSKKVRFDNQAERLRNFYWSLNSILRYALQNFTDIRRVVYTTCSVFPTEGEKVVSDALNEVGDSFTLVDLRGHLDGWVNQGITQVLRHDGHTTVYTCASKCLRTVPDYDRCHGYFIAMFDRNFEVPVPPYVRRVFKNRRLKPTKEQCDKESTVYV